MLKEENIEKVKLFPIIFKTDKGYIVDLEKMTCTCPYYQRPWEKEKTKTVICKHLVAARRIYKFFSNPESLKFKCANCQGIFPFDKLLLKEEIEDDAPA
ncbi:MAG: SWIM zinc finger family protein [Candidatus Micrarchaeia archaeon]